jgi:hypothetical protein
MTERVLPRLPGLRIFLLLLGVGIIFFLGLPAFLDGKIADIIIFAVILIVFIIVGYLIDKKTTVI